MNDNISSGLEAARQLHLYFLLGGQQVGVAGVPITGFRMMLSMQNFLHVV